MGNSYPRVFITGLSALTSCGNNLDATWQAICSGQSGIGSLSEWDISSWSTPLGGEIKNFQAGRMLPDRKLAKVISRHDVMGINAAVQAIEHSGMIHYRDSTAEIAQFNEETAVFVGSPGNKYFQQYDFLPLLAKTGNDMQAFAGQLFNEVHPMWLLRILPNNVLAYTGITYGFKGPNHNITNHAVGGTQALLEAYHAIRAGQAKRAIVVAYDTGIEPQALFYYDKLGLISSEDLRPFDKSHDGTILAEGAAAIVLESEESVQERGAGCYAELMGGLAATDGNSLFAVDNGESLAALLQKTVQCAQKDVKDFHFIAAHGNGNIKSDESEAAAISALFPQDIAVTAFKWATGHTLAASGVLDTVLAVYAINKQVLPGIANLTEVAQGCAQLKVQAEAQMLAPQSMGLIINRGFASMNACVVVKGCE